MNQMLESCKDCEHFDRNNVDTAGYADCLYINSLVLRTHEYSRCKFFLLYLEPIEQ